MQFLGKLFRSTTFIVVIVVLATAGASAGAILYARGKAKPRAVTASSRHATAAPTETTAASDLQVLMGGTDASATNDAQSGSGAAGGVEGPAGADGGDGLDGAAGADGANGADGVAGADGPAGPKGSVGATGPAGSVGATGPAGSVGATGPAGLGLTPVDRDGGGFEIQSPDGVSYRIHVTNHGIIFETPTTTEVWNGAWQQPQTLVP